MDRPIIIGGGISGLSAAFYLTRAGVEPLIVDPAPRLGGLIETVDYEGCRIECGPDSFLAAKPSALELIRELGLSNRVIASNDHQRRTWIWKGDRLVPFPPGFELVAPVRFGPIAASPLLGWGTKLRMAREYFRRPPRQPLPERSVSDFIRDHFGQQAVDYIAEPLLAGVWGGDPDRLSAPAVLPKFVRYETRYGSLARGALAHRHKGPGGPLFRSLEGGMGQLIGALEASLAGRARVVRSAAKEIQRHGARYRLRLETETLETSQVVLACRAWQAAPLLAPLSSEAAALLEAIPYTSALTVALGYDAASLGHPLDGFGFLVPRKHRQRLLACTWVGRKFNHRVPEGLALLRCFLGGSPEEVAAEPDQALVALCREELGRIMGIGAEPRFHHVSRLPRSMPQYVLGHQQRIARLFELAAEFPGLHLTGNAFDGVGIPDCIRHSRSVAARIASQTGARA